MLFYKSIFSVFFNECLLFDFSVHPAKVIRSFAETLRSRWKLGRCDNDILIVVATTDRLVSTVKREYLIKNNLKII